MLKAGKMTAVQFPEIKDSFHDLNKQKRIKKNNEIVNMGN
jgi:hypothetical protein